MNSPTQRRTVSVQYFGHDLLSTLGTAHSEMLDHTQQSVLLSTGTGEKLSGIPAVRTCCNDVYSFGTRVQSCVVPVWYVFGLELHAVYHCGGVHCWILLGQIRRKKPMVNAIVIFSRHPAHRTRGTTTSRWLILTVLGGS